VAAIARQFDVDRRTVRTVLLKSGVAVRDNHVRPTAEQAPDGAAS
jgi:hypothetical protein